MTKQELAAASVEADKAWIAAYMPLVPKGVWPGDFRYTDAAKGEPGSELRRAYDKRCAATDAYFNA